MIMVFIIMILYIGFNLFYTFLFMLIHTVYNY